MTQSASTQRALRELVKSLSATRAGRIGLVAIVAVVLVGAVWINALAGDAPSPGASSSPSASAAREASAGVSEAALPHARQLAHQASHAAHIFHLAQLLKKVVEIDAFFSPAKTNRTVRHYQFTCGINCHGFPLRIIVNPAPGRLIALA